MANKNTVRVDKVWQTDDSDWKVKWTDVSNDRQFTKLIPEEYVEDFKTAHDNADVGATIDVFYDASWKKITNVSLGGVSVASPETQREAKEKGVDALSAMQDNPAPRTPTLKRADTERNRSMALAYAKDLAVAGKIEVEKIMLTAETFVTYIEE